MRPSADELRRLKDEAAEASATGKLEKAVELYRQVAQGDPRDVAARQKLAEALRRAGRIPETIEAYGAVAARFGHDGFLIKAIAISKTILELDPEHVATQASLAELYAQRAAAEGARPPRRATLVSSPRTTAPAPAPGPVGRSAPPAADGSTGLREICFAADEAIEAGIDEEIVIEADPGDVEVAGDELLLPRVPIFSDLSRDAFVALTRGMVLHRVARGEAVLREREEGTSFYVVAGGRFAVSRREDSGGTVTLAHLGEGEFFGEMALLSGAPRSATVTAEEDGEVLEFRADALLGISRQHPQLARSLRRFYRQRLLANALAVSPIFKPFDGDDRKRLMDRFRAREVAAGEVVIREGEPSDGLYVVLEGAVDVVKRREARTVAVGQLREGDLFGEMSCLRKAPASATVVVRRPGTLLRLPRSEFDDLVMSHPQILEVLSALAEERAESLDAILSGHAQWTEDGLVLI